MTEGQGRPQERRPDGDSDASRGEGRPERGASDRGRGGADGGRGASDRGRGGVDRGARPDRRGGGRPPFADRDRSSQDRARGGADRGSWGDRDRPARGDRPGGGRPDRAAPRGDGRPDRGDRPSFGRGEGRFDRGDRPSFGRGEGRADRGGRPEGGASRGEGRFDRGDRSSFGRGEGRFDRGDRPSFGRGEGRADRGERPNGDRSYGDRAGGGRPSGDRPGGDRSGRPLYSGGDRGDRGGRPERGGRPDRDRPDRNRPDRDRAASGRGGAGPDRASRGERPRNAAGHEGEKRAWGSYQKATPDPARRAAFDLLVSVAARDAYANLALPPMLVERRITGRDAAFVTELTYGTLRHRGTLDAILAAGSSRPIDKVDLRVLQALRLGAYQLLFTRVPDHAAVAGTVEVARVALTDGPARFVNAVLRRVAERSLDEWLTEVTPALSEDPIANLAITHSHPEWVVRVFADALGDTTASLGEAGSETAKALAADNERPAVDLAARPGRITPTELAGEIEAHLTRWTRPAPTAESTPATPAAESTPAPATSGAAPAPAISGGEPVPASPAAESASAASGGESVSAISGGESAPASPAAESASAASGGESVSAISGGEPVPAISGGEPASASPAAESASAASGGESVPAAPGGEVASAAPAAAESVPAAQTAAAAAAEPAPGMAAVQPATQAAAPAFSAGEPAPATAFVEAAPVASGGEATAAAAATTASATAADGAEALGESVAPAEERTASGALREGAEAPASAARGGSYAPAAPSGSAALAAQPAGERVPFAAAGGPARLLGRWSPVAVRLPEGAPGDVAAVADGRAHVQDEGSQLCAWTLAAAPLDGTDARWLDLCAGPGGKAGLLASIAAGRGAHLTAVEITEHRAKLVEEAVRGLPATVLTTDGRTVGTHPDLPEDGFDRVLVDAPCTGLGALRRRPEARWRREPGDVPALAKLQRELLTAALRAVRPGGLVAYVTCSPHVAETRVVVADVCRRTGAEPLDVRIVPEAAAAADLNPTPERVSAARATALQLWPHRHGTDAMFLSLLRKPVGGDH